MPGSEIARLVDVAWGLTDPCSHMVKAFLCTIEYGDRANCSSRRLFYCN